MKTATDLQRRAVIEKHLAALEKQKAAQTAQINRLNNQLNGASSGQLNGQLNGQVNGQVSGQLGMQSSVSRWVNLASLEQLRCACDVLLEEVLRRERARERTEEDTRRVLAENRELLQQRGRAGEW